MKSATQVPSTDATCGEEREQELRDRMVRDLEQFLSDRVRRGTSKRGVPFRFGKKMVRGLYSPRAA